MFDAKYDRPLENECAAPTRASVVLKKEDRNQQRVWELAFEAFCIFGDLEQASMCLGEVRKHEPGYDYRKLFQSARLGEALESKIPYHTNGVMLVQEDS